jgi:hypothetical protein
VIARTLDGRLAEEIEQAKTLLDRDTEIQTSA